MPSKISRRGFVGKTAAASLCSLIPRLVGAASGATRKVTVGADEKIGTVRPEFHGHFAEHLGSCVYGGLWVGKNSPIPNINGYRQQAVEYSKALGIPVLRWPGGCYADDYHWRDGIGPLESRPKRVNIPPVMIGVNFWAHPTTAAPGFIAHTPITHAKRFPRPVFEARTCGISVKSARAEIHFAVCVRE